jgi:hypothetical protein
VTWVRACGFGLHNSPLKGTETNNRRIMLLMNSVPPLEHLDVVNEGNAEKHTLNLIVCCLARLNESFALYDESRVVILD